MSENLQKLSLTERAEHRLSMTRRRFGAGLAAAAASAPFLPYGRARAATEINFVGWQGYDEPLTAGGFLEKNDITMERTYIDANEAIITKLQAGGMGQIDVVTPYYGHANIMIGAGQLEPLDMSQLPAFEQMMPFFANQEMLRKDGQQYAVPFTWGTQPPMYRADLVAEADRPKTWEDLMNPRFKGKLVMIGGAVLSIAVYSKVLLKADPPTWINHDQLKQVIDYLINMKKVQARLYTDSYGEMTDVLARGDAEIVNFGWEPVVLWAAEKGAEIAFNYPKGGAFAFMDTYCVPTDAPHPEIAHKLINHGISVEGQTHLAEALGQAVVNSEAVPKLSEQNRNLYHYKEVAAGDTEALADIAWFAPFPPLEPDGTHATHDDWLEEWERFMKA